MPNTLDDTRFEYLVQTELVPEEGFSTLVCPTCMHQHLLETEWLALRIGDVKPCNGCGLSFMIPNPYGECENGRAQEGLAPAASEDA